MKITLRSQVEQDLETVAKRFDVDLFKYLLPPGAELLQFGGSHKGDVVHLKLPLAGEWVSEISEHGSEEGVWYFIDEGRKLPFPLKRWKHKHILRATGDQTIVEDHMYFTTGTFLGNVLFYPVLFLSFLPRIKQYKRYFKGN